MASRDLAGRGDSTSTAISFFCISFQRLLASMRLSTRRRFRRSVVSRILVFLTLIGALVAMLLTLAVLEYRWEGVSNEAGAWIAAKGERMQVKHLVINLGLLLVLVSAVATIIVYVSRAQNLVRLQMEFVANVSHDLRTPLSVISSAADNLAEGVVRSDESVREYGSLIRSECRRLSDMVEQTLRFAAGKADYRARNIRFLRVADIIDETLRDAQTIVKASGFKIEKEIDPKLPMIRVDGRALSECLSNLVNNALKYGGESRWIGIQAHPVETGRGTGVQVTVKDRGPGIASDELALIFEPFYRGKKRPLYSSSRNGTRSEPRARIGRQHGSQDHRRECCWTGECLYYFIFRRLT